MSSPFSHSLRALRADEPRGFVTVMAGGGLLFLAWMAWFFWSTVPVYEISQMARLESEQEAHQVQAPVGGRVVSTRMTVGDAVSIGDELVEIDADSEQLRLDEARALQLSLRQQIEALKSEAHSTEEALRALRRAGDAERVEALAYEHEAASAAALAREEMERQELLKEKGHISDAEIDRTAARATQLSAAATAASQRLERIDWQYRQQAGDRAARRDQIAREILLLEGELAATDATVTRLAKDVQRCTIRSPIDGVLGEVSPLRIGAVVRVGDPIAAVVPRGRLKAVARFLPRDALGRVLPGQSAQLRLVGFPWTQYGTVKAVVDRVALEPRDGVVRVDFGLRDTENTRIPLQHGLPGSVEVHVEDVSPALLVFRLAGQWIGDTPRHQE